MSKQTVSLKYSGLKLAPKNSRAVLLISYYYLGYAIGFKPTSGEHVQNSDVVAQAHYSSPS